MSPSVCLNYHKGSKVIAFDAQRERNRATALGPTAMTLGCQEVVKCEKMVEGRVAGGGGDGFEFPDSRITDVTVSSTRISHGQMETVAGGSKGSGRGGVHLQPNTP